MLIEIPVSEFIKKIIILEEGDEPIRVRLDSLFGRLLHSSVGLRAERAVMKDKYTEVIQVELPKVISDYSVNRVKLSLINETYYHKFKDNMFTFIKAQTKAGLSVRVAIDNFLIEYNLKDEDYSAETARREWNRYLNRKKNIKN